MLSKNRFDQVVESFTRRITQRTSRRSFLGRLGGVVTGSVLLPLLPVDRRLGAAHAQPPLHREGWLPQAVNPELCNYWRHCSIDGNLCTCCGGDLTHCPPGTFLSPSSWVASCHNPQDGQSYLIAYRDCCGTLACPRCGCLNTEGELPIYRPEFSNDIVWCFGAEATTYHCTIQPIVGKA